MPLCPEVFCLSMLGRSPSQEDQLCAHRYFRAITEYMQQLRHSLGELRDDIEYDLPNRQNLTFLKSEFDKNLPTRAVAQEELNAADAEKITGIAILSFIRYLLPSFVGN